MTRWRSVESNRQSLVKLIIRRVRLKCLVINLKKLRGRERGVVIVKVEHERATDPSQWRGALIVYPLDSIYPRPVY
jgi:hypothetical protein